MQHRGSCRQYGGQHDEADLARQDHEFPLVVLGFLAQIEVAVERATVLAEFSGGEEVLSEFS